MTFKRTPFNDCLVHIVTARDRPLLGS